MTISSGTIIKTQNLRIGSLDGLSDFYGRLLGMRSFHEASASVSFGFSAESCRLVFRKTNVSSYCARPNDFYWKIGITLRNLDAAIAFLRKNELDVPDPFQFRDIGYMTKINDPNGFIIELLQQGFEGNEKPVPDGHPVSVQGILAHITLRVTDIASARRFFEERLRMRLMSVQPVEAYGFCLYFYSWSDETLPNPKLEAVDNREWLWGRPYTFIELQHLQSAASQTHKTADAEAGFDGFAYGDRDSEALSFVSIDELEHLS